MAKGNFALGAIIGAVAGVVAGVLTAPKSGKETRADLKNKANELKDEAVDKADQVKAKADKTLKDTQSAVDGYKDRATRAMNSAKKEFQEEAKKK